MLGRALSLHTSPLEHSKVLKIPTFRVNAFFCSNVNSLKGYHNKPLLVISNSAWIGLLDFFFPPPAHNRWPRRKWEFNRKFSLKWAVCCCCLPERKICRGSYYLPSLPGRPELIWMEDVLGLESSRELRKKDLHHLPAGSTLGKIVKKSLLSL